MKVFIMSVALVGVATAAPLLAQGNGRNVDGIPPGQRPRAGMCRVWIDGVPPGRQSAPTNCATAQARAAANGGRVIYGSNSRNRQDCTYDQTTNSVSDIIFGRTGTNNTNRSGTNSTDCRDNTSRRVNGPWHSVGSDNGGTIYERRTRDSNGNVIIQRARRDAFGNMSIISTRNASNNGTWNGRNRGDDDDQGENGKGHGKWKKGKKSKGDNDYSYSRGDDRYYQGSNAVARGNGKGRDHKDRD